MIDMDSKHRKLYIDAIRRQPDRELKFELLLDLLEMWDK